jgi:hypothetical protein
MNNLKSLVFATTLLGGALFSSPAAAISSFSGSLSNIRYTLVDWEPTDGVAPSIIFNGGSSYIDTFAGLGGLSGGVRTETTTFGARISKADLSPLNNAQSTALYPGAIGSSPPLEMSISGVADVLTNGIRHPWYGKDMYGAHSGAALYFGIDYTLSAHTDVIFEMDYLLTATNDEPSVSDTLQHLATMKLNFFVGAYDPDYNNIFVDVRTRRNYPRQYSGSLALVAYNPTSSNVPGSFWASFEGRADDYSRPVPEPETYALMCAGLFALGFVAKRRTA